MLDKIQENHETHLTAHADNTSKVLDKVLENQEQSTRINQKLNRIHVDKPTVTIHDSVSRTVTPQQKVNENSRYHNFREDENTNPKTVVSSAENTPKSDLWIIGSSIIKDLHARRIYKNKFTKINTLKDKTVYGALEFVKLGRVNSKNMLFQIGSNDLETKEAKEVLAEIENLVVTTQTILPQANIILAAILPRYLRNRKQQFRTKTSPVQCPSSGLL